MAVIRIRDRNALAPSHVVMIVLVCAIIAGGGLLLSAAESRTLVDGARPWEEGSVLKSVVAFLCLSYAHPTTHADALKGLILGIGAGLAALVLGVSLMVRPFAEEASSDAEMIEAIPEGESPPDQPRKAHIAPLLAAQVFTGLYLLWSFASARWSAAPQLAIGGSVLLAVQFLWALAIGNGLSPGAARIASRAIVVVSAITSVVAIWYFYGRNPVIRAKFPYGNPLFLAACLIPGIALTLGLLMEKLAGGLKEGLGRSAGWVVTGIVTLVLCAWAFKLTGDPGPLSTLHQTGSRAALLGLIGGGLAAVFFALRGGARWISVAAGVGVFILGWTMYGSSGDDLYGRETSLRLREYAWNYAFEMYGDRRFIGHGQGGFALKGDSYVEGDVYESPTVFTSRIAHAHNEWLEVLADLGSIGFVLIATVLVLTLRAGMLALAARPPPGQRWALIALMGALVGLVVEESFSVGLRVAGVPTMFYTVLGLTWALSGTGSTSPVSRLPDGGPIRKAVGLLACGLGLAAMIASQLDFNAARNLRRITRELDENQLDRAVELAEYRTTQLSPQRALENLALSSEAELRAAFLLQSRATDRLRRAAAGDLSSGQLKILAREDLNVVADRCTSASAMLTQLIGFSPGYLNHGWMEYRLRLIQAGTAEMKASLGDTVPEGEAQRFLEQAAASLQRELRRQPFNPALAIEYSRFMGSGLPLEGHIELLARPLRYDRLSPVYHDHLMSLSRAEDFDARFAPIVARARLRLSALALPLPDQPDTWAPEILRLAAAVFFTEGRFSEAVEGLELAARRYETLPSSTRISAASCYADLALCRFFLNPSDPLPAIEAAQRGAEITPESEAGRAMRRGIKIKAVDYLLAAGLENEAAQSLRETAPPGTVDEVVRRQLGIRYSRMSYDLLQRRSPDGTRMPLADFPEQFDTWLARSLELATDDHVAHLVLADLTFFRGDEAAAAVQLRQALEKGLSIEEAWRYVTLALAQQPDAAALRSLMEEIKARVAQMPPQKRPNLPSLPAAAEADPTTPVSVPPEASDSEPPDTDSP